MNVVNRPLTAQHIKKAAKAAGYKRALPRDLVKTLVTLAEVNAKENRPLHEQTTILTATLANRLPKEYLSVDFCVELANQMTTENLDVLLLAERKSSK